MAWQAMTRVGFVDVCSTSDQKDFDWTIRPLAAWLRCIGVDLDWSTSAETDKWRPYASVAWGSVVFVANTGAIGLVLHNFDDYTKSMMAPEASNSSFLRGLVIVDAYSNCFYVLAVHLWLLAMTSRRYWPRLIQSIHAIESMIQIQAKPRFDIRKRWLIFLAATIIVKLAISAFLFWAEEGLGALQVMQHIVPDSCLVLFCLTAWTLSLHFEKLHEEIERWTNREIGAAVPLDAQLRTWNRLHMSVCQAGARLNDCFAPALLASVSFFFVGVTCYAYYIYRFIGKEHTKYPALLVLTIDFMCKMWAITYSSDRIKNQALRCVTTLRRLRSKAPHFDQQLSLMAMQFQYTIPEVQVLGFFCVDRGLIPGMIGTALTYFIILCQFRVSE